jgi:DNA gyrase/topoisomerase IV subunit A
MPLVTPEKIEEWLKEIEVRPSSAPFIIELIARRLQELLNRCEALLAENIELQSGRRVEEYERRIAHLEYQLELLKRQFPDERWPVMIEPLEEGTPAKLDTTSLIISDISGHVLRFEINPQNLSIGFELCKLSDKLLFDKELPRLLAAPTSEELLFVFTSGRVSVLPVSSIPAASLEGQLSLGKASIPDEPRAGEKLACMLPISRLPLSEFFLQTSRRGYLKKINVSMAQSILANHYIGTGIKQPPDITFGLLLCTKEDRLVLVSRDGYLQCLEVKSLPVTVDEALRLEPSDHLVAACISTQDQAILAITQGGKVIHLAAGSVEISSSFKIRGQALFSAKRRAAGTKIVGAAVVRENEWGVVLHQNGNLTVHPIREIVGAGSVPADGDLLAFATFGE